MYIYFIDNLSISYYTYFVSPNCWDTQIPFKNHPGIDLPHLNYTLDRASWNSCFKILQISTIY